MKRNTLILAISTLLFSFFFYEQRAGINFTFFSLALVAMLALDDPKRLKDPRWLIFAALSLVSGFFVGWHGTVISVMANITALSVLAVHTLLPKTSFFPAFIFSVYSYLSSFVYMIIDLSERSSSGRPRYNPAYAPGNYRHTTEKAMEPDIQNNFQDKTSADKPKLETGAKVVIGVIGLAVLIVFISLYRKASPVFKEFTDNINLDFISFPWLAFTFLGFLLMYGFFFIRHHKNLHENDVNAPAQLSAEKLNLENGSFLGFRMDMRTEAIIVMIFLGLLNLLLLLLNVIDISFMASGGDLPTDVTYADFVHKGVGTLIVSVIFVIAIVMYFFRGALNFYEKSSSVRLLANIWLAQNLILLIATAFRNSVYVAEYDLTYKRIGVYVWLLLTAFGLITTLYKVMKKSSTWYLIRTNGWAFFAAILLLGTVNWDILIAKYNTRNVNDFDYEYLSRMNDNSLPAVYHALQQSKPEHVFSFDTDYHNSRFGITNSKDEVESRIRSFNAKYEKMSWKSWNYDDWVTYNNLP
ncbi:MAG: DUF4173 domain-containing protein [Bacteroidales bacterium]